MGGLPGFQFTDPRYLWLLAGFSAFLFFSYLRILMKGKRLSGSKTFFEQFLILRKQMLRQYLKECAVFGLLFAIGVMFLSGMQYQAWVPHFFKEDVVMCWSVDISGSTRAEEGHFGPDGRIGQSKREIREFLAPPFPAGIPQCLVVFAGEAIPVQEATSNYDLFLQKLDAITPDFFENQGTNFEAAIKVTADMFPEQAKIRRLILESDGDKTESEETDVDFGIAYAREKKIVIDTIAVGFARSPVPGRRGIGFLENENRETTYTEVDEATLYKIAKDTGGESYTYKNSGELKKHLSKIFEDVKTKATRPVPVWTDADVPLGSLGLMLFFLFFKINRKIRLRDYIPKFFKFNFAARG